MKLLDNRKVSTKVAISMGAVLVLMLAASAIGVFGLLDTENSFTGYRGLARESNAANAIQNRLLAARVQVEQFILTGSEETGAAAGENVAAAVARARAAAELFQDAATKARLEGLAQQLDAYGREFAAILPLEARRRELSASLNESGPQAEQLISTMVAEQAALSNIRALVAASNAMRNLLLMQLYANRFLIENGQEQVAAVETQLGEMQGHLQTLGVAIYDDVGQKQLEDLTALVASYREAFMALAEVIAERNRIVSGNLAPLGEELAGSLAAMGEDAIARQNRLGPEAQAEIGRSVNLNLVVTVVALLVGILLAILVSRGIARPIQSMTAAMKRLAEGDKAAEVPAQDRRDEVGEMAAAVQVFKENMIRNEELAAAQEAERAQREQRAARIEQLTRDFDTAVAEVLAQVEAAAGQMQSTAGSMAATAEETNRQAGAVAAASEQASANVQTVAAAAEELSASIEEIGRQVTQAAGIAGRASEDAQRTNAQVDGLARAAQKIGEVISLIQDIAEQTNLLALNATIEAARAGEAGKGFAVVASEVKNLASQTARATEQIGQQIGAIQAETEQAVSAIQGIGLTIDEINQIATSIASAVEEQGAATKEISRNVAEAARGTREVSENIAGVTQAASETGNAAEQVNQAAGRLASQAEQLSQAVARFLTEVKAS